MKKSRTDFEPRLKSGGKKYSGLRLIETFFHFNDLATTKERLNSMMHYAVKKNGWIKEDLSVIFQFHQSMRSFIGAGYLISMEAKKWTVNPPTETTSPLMQGSLSDAEYQKPLLVFQSAFKKYSVKEFDYFLSGIVYFSLQVYRNGPERNLVSPYIYLLKMLDAAYLILERGIRKNK